MEEVTTRTLEAAGMTPARAYAALRAKSPGRTSFLIEMTAPDERGEQRSTIGFLTKRESAYPPASDVLRELFATASAMPAAEAHAELGPACFRDVLALLAFDAVLPALGVAPWPDQPFVGREMRDVASVVFDHAAGTITIVATNANVVERCARVIASAPELPDLPPAGGTKPEYMTEQPPDAAFVKQLARAERRLALGGVERLLLGRTFKSQTRGADLFDVYRALRESAPARYAFFAEMPVSPMFPTFAVAATGDGVLRVTAAAGEDAVRKELLALFPVDATSGAPAKEALGALRDLDVGARGMRGGGLARVRPGGHIEVIRSEVIVTFEEEQFQAHGVAEVVPGRDAQAHTAAAEQEALAALTAIRRAQDAALAREAAAAAAEQAATPSE